MKKLITTRNTPSKEGKSSKLNPGEGGGAGLEIVPFPAISDGSFKKIFYISLITMLLITLISGYNTGFNSDEIEMNNYGKANYAYYLSGGKDTTVMGSYYTWLKYYGNAFELIAVGVNKIIGLENGPNEFNVRHIINQLVGIIGLLFTGFVARKFAKNWLVPIVTIWLLFLTPSFMGHFFFNTRDIPFCTGYIATMYFIINFLEELPSPSWNTALSLMLAFAFTTNIRVGGFLLVLYLLLFTALYLLFDKQLLSSTLKNIKGIVMKFIVIVAGGTSIVILTWPFILMHPSSLIDALGVAKKFPLKVAINFEGGTIDSLNVPSHYIPKYMFVTIPIAIIVCIVGGFVVYFLNRKKYNWKLGLVGLFSIFFPVIYAIATNAALYSSWRHFLFIFPLMCIFGGVFFTEMLSRAKKPIFKIGIIVVFIVAMVKPVLFSIQNNPYEYCYFNEFAGDFKTAYYNYDNDYWSISVKKSVDWLMQHEGIAQSKDSITIGTNTVAFLDYYIPRHYPGAKIRLVNAGVTSRSVFDWKYCVFSTLFVKPDYIETYYPLPRAIHTENIEGLAVTTVLKDTERLDVKALAAFSVNNYALADSLYTVYFRTTKDHDPVLGGYVSIVKASLGQNDIAVKEAKTALQYHFSDDVDYYAQCGLGIAYANMKQYDQSMNALQAAQNLNPGDTYAKIIMNNVLTLIQQEKKVR